MPGPPSSPHEISVPHLLPSACSAPAPTPTPAAAPAPLRSPNSAFLTPRGKVPWWRQPKPANMALVEGGAAGLLAQLEAAGDEELVVVEVGARAHRGHDPPTQTQPARV